MPQSHHPYPDHLFGDLDKPQKGAARHVRDVLGVRHHAVRSPWLPADGQAVTLRASTSADICARSVVVSFTTDDWATSTDLPFTPTQTTWDTTAWTWLRHWVCELPPMPSGTMLRYYVWAGLPGGKRAYAETQSSTSADATPYALWLDPHPNPPAWAADAVTYQVFVDRFNPGAGRDWLQTANLCQPFGGTLRGVTEKLDHIKALGCNTVWLTPIFKSPTHHGYDASDYAQIEPRFGTEADLRELIAGAHARGMRLLLDFVANHTSDQHWAMQSALASPESPERAWYKWEKWPRYTAYYDVRSMPELNLALGSPARVHLLEIAQKWLTLGVDGYRLDYAPGPGQEFWADFRRACRAVNPDCWTFGEVVGPADEQLSFAGTMDGTLDFLTCQALRETFATRGWPLSRFAAYLENNPLYFPRGFSRPAFIDNHDMNRFLFTALGSLEAEHAALTMLYLLPGQPIIYYGTESDLPQAQSIHDPGSPGFDEARGPMNWASATGHPTAGLLRQLADFRAANPWLGQATWQTETLDEAGGEALFRVSGDGHALRVRVRFEAGQPRVGMDA